MGKTSQKRAEETALKMHVMGRVQGVGFRPYIFRLANKYKLRGEVFNRPDGVIIHIEGDKNACEAFLSEMPDSAPGAAVIKEIVTEEAGPSDFTDFRIVASEKSEHIITEICPDIAICDDCLRELYSPGRRKEYPLINCTNCGPRFTLIQDFPYDRHNTTMSEFEMCPECLKEYKDPGDRRFHAQPTSCFVCGPHYELHWHNEVVTDFQQVIWQAAENINDGKVVALKGLGGYNLCCDATCKKAVQEIRKFKKREKKPFAVLYRSIECLKEITDLSRYEEQALQSWRRPIVIVDKLLQNPFPDEISCGLDSLGVFLPYLPLHYLLFDKIRTDALVLTSGNESDVPILCREEDALMTFRDISGGILINNRKIARRADDSVVRVVENKPRLMRRARGYVPAPIDLNFPADGILATGAELSNAFCIGKGNQAILSQHIGDLKNAETYDFFRENLAEFSRIYRFSPKQIVCDQHPDYLSTQYAKASGLPVVRAQHHHAHIASAMAEYELNGTVIGLAYDGTGFGTDGHIWGSELMIADYRNFLRRGHYEYIPLPGGDLVTKEPWRTGLSLLYMTYGEDWSGLNIPLIKTIDPGKAKIITEAIRKKINTPLSCGAGRLFDAVAAILGICHESNYHAEAPLLLENYLMQGIEDSYTIEGSEVISFRPAIKEICDDIRNKIPFPVIVTKFHNTVAAAAFGSVKRLSSETGLNRVILSGGSFQNKYLTEKLVHLLRNKDLEVFIPAEVSCNDGGIALGQLAIAAHNLE